MLQIVLGFGFLFNPMGFTTPARNIEIIHFGYTVNLAAYDDAYDQAAAPWKADPLWGWMVTGNSISSTTRVMLAPFYEHSGSQKCDREVEWSVVQSVGSGSMMFGYTVVLNPRILDTELFQPDLVAAFSR